MTYRFLCRYFKPWLAGWLTAIWFAILILCMIMLGSNEENMFLYMDF